MTDHEESAIGTRDDHRSDVKRRILDKLLRGGFERTKHPRPTITRRPPGEPVPLSYQQEQVWLHAQMAAEVPFYNEAITVYRRGPLHQDILERCLLEILRRHEVWRTSFEVCDGIPVQVVKPVPASFPLTFVDLRSVSASERDPEAKRLATEDARLPFDLKRGPLLRACLICMGDDEYRLYMTFHQIIFDAVSAYRVFLPELATLYEALSSDNPSPLPEPAIQYGDFSYWQRKRLPPEVWAEQLDFWRKHLSGDLPLLEWPTDRPRPAAETHRGEIQRFTFSADLVRPLRDFARKEGASLYMTLLAGLAAVLYRYTGQEEVILGSPTAGRKLTQTDSMLGYFVNPVAFRIDLSGRPTFRELLARVRGEVLDALAHDEVPYPRVVKEILPKPDPGRNPLFQVMLSQQPAVPPMPTGWNLVSEEVSNGGSKMDLIIVVDEKDDDIFGPVTYNPDLFEPSTISRMIDHWQRLLAVVVHDPGQHISDVPILSDAERTRILLDWNDNHIEYRKDLCLHEFIEAQVEKSPEATALIFEDQNLSYRELNTRANQLAHYLRALGVGADSLVGVCMERSVEMVVALLGVLKAGGAYVPLDPEYPRDRLSMMIEDSRPTVVLTQQHLIERLPGERIRVVSIDSEWQQIAKENGSHLDRASKPENLSYVIYTSGSTGRPKGALNTHAGIVNRLLWMQDAYQLTNSDRVLQKTPYSFDVSVWEFFWPLMTGACLVVAKPGGHQDPDYLVDLICRERITTIHFVPSMLRAFLEVKGIEECASLKRVICSGEALPFDVQERFFARSKAELHNLYGPTEAAVDVTYWQCQRESKDSVVPLGRPIANVPIYLLDRNLQPVPVGVPGELHIGGVALARGYLNRPELTAAKFIPDPISNVPGARLYKTGDLARYRADGIIEYLGRIDDQVKIRGFRIELGEIESVLREYPAVRDAAVIVREDIPGDRRLVAYIVLAGPEAASLADILAFARRKLPAYMVPDLVPLDRLPLTSNGKLNRRALPAPQKGRQANEGPTPEPKDGIEKLLVQLWRDILKVEHVSVYDNFFDLGGHSLSAIQVVARLQNQLGVRIKPNEVAFQTLGQLAAVCKERLQRT